MSDQQQSKTPTTDEAEALGPVTVLETCRVFEMGIKELRQQVATANAEVERLKAEAQQVELDKRSLRDAVNTSDALAKVVKDLLANSKALARHLDVRDRTAPGTDWYFRREELLTAHNKLMEQFK